MRPRRRLAAVVAASLALSLVVPLVLSQALPAGPVRLVVWHPFPEDGDMLPALQALLAAFARERPDVVLELVPGPPDLRAGLEAARRSRSLPDAVIGSHEWLPELVASGFVRSLERADLPPAALPGLAAAVQVNGAPYGVPLFFEVAALLYDPERVEPPATLEALEAAGRALRRDDSYGLAFDPRNAFFVAPFLYALGGRFEAPVPAATPEREPAAEPLTEWLEWLARLGREVLPPGVDYATAMELWRQGRVAMTINGPWALEEMRDAGRALAVAPLPGGPGPARPWLEAQVLMVTSARAARVSDALALARVLQAPGLQARWGAALALLPVNPAAYREPPLAGDALLAAFWDAAAGAVPVPSRPGLDDLWTVLPGVLDAVLKGEVAAAVAADWLRDLLAQADPGGGGR